MDVGWIRHTRSAYITTCAWIVEATGWPSKRETKDGWRSKYFDWFKYQFWRFVFVQQLSGQGNPTFSITDADAAGRELQSGSGQSGDGRKGMAEAGGSRKGTGR